MPDGGLSPIPGLVGRGDWVHTFSGGRFYPMSPRVEDVRLVDVAHHLSMKARWLGAVLVHYSIAQHSWLLSNLVPPELAYAALHHDDNETYLPDVPTPVKPHIPGWPELEALHTRVIAVDGFGVDPAELLAVKPWDRRIQADEARDILNPSEHPWKVRHEPLGVSIDPWPQKWAFDAWMDRHAELTRAGFGATRLVR